ncbi:glutamate-1-semialdehyde 2,1-aminomutase [Hydrogenibacillus sp. N12]|uniref:glutamate-1-semialdehyde 2,1-aminomutase n=1 Tax=Hydrogenibacillus sp. N12 TaxID=2866627 RepID=UPI001C7DE1DA|nr:glutamate-1-semialdehyde 2,1-aminomutase [Hydrogenibacillus sp. N12]QZA33370.1 glutamate-1-semialdehyde 2,1-aminomutase [Hydrogenibacillus sp. N12]
MKRTTNGRNEAQALDRHEAWYARALDVITGGVNSPSRSYKAVGGGAPRFFVRGEGAYLYDVDGRRYIDYLAAFGPLILGHAHPALVRAIRQAAEEGTLFGTPTPYEVEFAERLRAAIPELERVRLTNSGTEAVMTAVRLARAYTGRSKIIKFAGAYHGHFDLVLVAAGSGPATLGVPDAAGVPASVARDVVTVPYNDSEALALAVERFGSELAAIVVEPIVGNFGIVPPEPAFLEAIHRLARECGALVVYDEVITAFRFRYGSVMPMLGTRADLIALGKIIGGGLPIGAYGGRAEIMALVAPEGPVYQAGTMAGNPASVRAGLALLEALQAPGLYDGLEAKARALADGLLALSDRYGIPLQINRVGGAFSTHFTDRPVRTYADAEAADGALYAAFFRGMLRRGVLLPPSKFEAWFVMAPHSDADVAETLAAAEATFREMAAAPRRP